MTDQARELAAAVALEFRNRVRDEYLPRIGRCVSLLSEDELWRKPSDFGNSVANLLLHLEGNVQQWILSGVAGQADHRNRDGEFAAAQGPSAEAMLAQLEATVAEAVAVVDALTPAQLLEVKTFQGRWEHTCLSAVLHVMEHFSGHAGQIYAWTKQVRNVDLKFWDL